jgi:hypothetical protein
LIIEYKERMGMLTSKWLFRRFYAADGIKPERNASRWLSDAMCACLPCGFCLSSTEDAEELVSSEQVHTMYDILFL